MIDSSAYFVKPAHNKGHDIKTPAGNPAGYTKSGS